MTHPDEEPTLPALRRAARIDLNPTAGQRERIWKKFSQRAGLTDPSADDPNEEREPAPVPRRPASNV